VIELVHGVLFFGTFAILWFLALFCLLPIEMGAEADAQSGAPLSPRLGRKALIALGIAIVLWTAFYALIRTHVFDL
jgi:predicted secreted protein